MIKLKVLFIKTVLFPFTLLPLRWAHCLGDILGRKLLMLNKKRLNIVRANLNACFPKLSTQEQQSLIEKIASESGKWIIETLGIWFGNPNKLKTRVKAKNIELLDAAYTKGKGVVLVIPHFGNWEMANFHIPYIYPTAAMYKATDSELIKHIVLDARARTTCELFPADGKGVRQAFKHLKKGKVLVVLADHLPSRKAGVYAPFFGVPALTGKLTHTLIKYNQSEVLVVTTRRKPKGEGFEVEFHPLEGMQTDDSIEAATLLNQGIEKAIMIAPEQYQWVYTRFDKQPKGQKTIYHYP